MKIIEQKRTIYQLELYDGFKVRLSKPYESLQDAEFGRMLKLGEFEQVLINKVEQELKGDEWIETGCMYVNVK